MYPGFRFVVFAHSEYLYHSLFIPTVFDPLWLFLGNRTHCCEYIIFLQIRRVGCNEGETNCSLHVGHIPHPDDYLQAPLTRQLRVALNCSLDSCMICTNNTFILLFGKSSVCSTIPTFCCSRNQPSL